jgi:carbamoyltransferase
MYILGINAFHAGSSACLIRDGQLVAAAEEERFCRQKYWAGFPVQAIRYCLREAGITPRELDHIGISRDPRANLYKKILYTLRKRPSLSLIRDRLRERSDINDLGSIMCRALAIAKSDLRAQLHNVEHHRAHIASAFFVSPFREAAVVSVDGFGDFLSTMTGVARDTRIQTQDVVHYPHSLGIFFTAITQWLGFRKFGDEGKIQGLAAYGDPVYLDDLRRIVRLTPDGLFELDLSYFIHWSHGVDMTWVGGSPELGTVYATKFLDRFGPARQPGAEITKHYADMAASVQAMLEEAEFHIVRALQRKAGARALCIAGGVALNSTFNGKVLRDTDFDDIYVQPAANDAGTALGAAYYIYHHVLGRPRGFVMDHAYTGPGFSPSEIEEVLQSRGIAYRSFSEEVLIENCAALLEQGKIVGWFQGRMEWGPRALGNRSILADPRRAEMKDVLNARIKHRESFRPFAPAILLESTGTYFEQSYPDPFMTKVYEVRPHKRAEIPATTHIDGTGRLQTVERSANALYWDLIKAFERRTGVPVVLNTSFNENEPIVCRPEEALECFLRTKMDVLVMGNFLVSKNKPDLDESSPAVARSRAEERQRFG